MIKLKTGRDLSGYNLVKRSMRFNRPPIATYDGVTISIHGGSPKPTARVGLWVHLIHDPINQRAVSWH